MNPVRSKKPKVSADSLRASRTSNGTSKGSSILEVLIAIAVLTLGISAAIMLVFGNQSLGLDNETNSEAIYQAKALLEQARASSTIDFLSITSSTSTSGIYTRKLTVLDLTQCRKEATSTVTWSVNALRTLKIDLVTNLTDVAGALAVGGDCIVAPPDSDWGNPTPFASDTMTPGKPTAIDVLGKVAYLGGDHSPYFYVASGTFVTFLNGFTLVKQPNALDAVYYPGSNKTYVYAAMDTSTKQLNVIDATDIYNPVLVASSTLANTSGSFPQGWRVIYYKDRLYVINRETAGAEFHIFNVSSPTSPIELGSGTSLNITVESIAIQEKMIGGVTKRFAYLATDQNPAELKVYDITDPFNIGTISEVVPARQDLPGNQDGASVYAIGNKLYFGRQSVSGGPDLYVFDITNPVAGLSLLESAEVGASVLHIVVAGKIAFLATSKVSKEIQIWNVFNSPITLIASYNFGHITDQGIDYETDFLYASGQAIPNFRILYSP